MDTNKKGNTIIKRLYIIIPLLIIGLGMILFPNESKLEDTSGKALAVALTMLYKMLWFPNVGLTVLVFDLVLFLHAIVQYNKSLKVIQTSRTFNGHLFSIFIYLLILYSTCRFQTFLAEKEILPLQYQYKYLDDVNVYFVFLIMLLAVVAVFSFIFKFTSKVNKKNN